MNKVKRPTEQQYILLEDLAMVRMMSQIQCNICQANNSECILLEEFQKVAELLHKWRERINDKLGYGE